MKKNEAENWIEHLTQHGFQAGLGYEVWPDGYDSWYVLVETREGHLYHLLSPAAVEHFIEHDGPEEYRESKKMQRYLECRECGARFSANPEHYHGWEGYLAHCGKAVRMCQRNPIDGAEYTVADLVDHAYLRKPHADDFALHSPLPYHARQTYYGIEKETTEGTKPPRIPDALRQPIEKPDARLVGLAMYHAGYKRNSEGVWTKARKQDKRRGFEPFQEGDRICYEITDSIPFTVMQVHRSPNLWSVRFREEPAA